MWLAVIMANHFTCDQTIFDYTETLSAITNPFQPTLNEYKPKFIAFFIVLYGLSISSCYSYNSMKQLAEEHGSTTWGSVNHINKLFSQDKKIDIFHTKYVSIGLDIHDPSQQAMAL